MGRDNVMGLEGGSQQEAEKGGKEWKIKLKAASWVAARTPLTSANLLRLKVEVPEG